jgi:type IV pilus assembly protein PilA
MWAKYNTRSGFTIVELLIVVVVIAILAAISIVAYNGIQARARLSAAQINSREVIKKAEAYNSINGSYPATATEFNSVEESKISGLGIKFLAASTLNSATGVDGIIYQTCTTSGVQAARVQYYDFVAKTSNNKYYYAGNSDGSCLVWSTPFSAN